MKIKLLHGKDESFFDRARERLAQRKHGFPEGEIVIGFSDAGELRRALSRQKIALLQELAAQSSGDPVSITQLAQLLRRDLTGVSRDVQYWQDAGVLRVTVVPNPGHGHKKLVTITAKKIAFEMVLA